MTCDHLIRLRILYQSLGSGLIDISTPVGEAAALWKTSVPRVALVVENKETFLNLATV